MPTKLKRKMSRQCTHAGSWYSSDANALRGQLAELIGKASCPTRDSAKAIIVPHAGYRFSGFTAAHAYKSINPGNFSRVFVIGPSHHQYFEGCALPEPHLVSYSTPLGEMKLDQVVLNDLRSQQEASFKVFSKANDEEEHSIEMQLPFLKFVFESRPDAMLVPIYVGSLVHNEDRILGRVLSKYFDDPGSLFIISSDFCHWGYRFRFTPKSFPDIAALVYPAGSTNARIESLDRQGMSLIAGQDSEGFYKYLQSTGNTICGKNGVLVLMQTMRHAQRKVHIEFVHYSQSAPLPELVSRSDSCVSYAAAVASPV